MTEPTITCPHCKTEIKLTESLAAPLIETTRRQFEQQLAKKDSDIATREQVMREKEKQLAAEPLRQKSSLSSFICSRSIDLSKLSSSSSTHLTTLM